MSRAKKHDLIWLRPEPNDRRPRFNREQITAAVLKIADSEGFEALTMKRIADELDCGIMTLYYYVRTKADLVALMHDAILAEILLPQLPDGWREGGECDCSANAGCPARAPLVRRLFERCTVRAERDATCGAIARGTRCARP